MTSAASPCCSARRAFGLAGLLVGLGAFACQVPNPAYSGASLAQPADAAAPDGSLGGTGGGAPPPPDATAAEDGPLPEPDTATVAPLDAASDQATTMAAPGCPADDPSLRLCLRFEDDAGDDSQYRHEVASSAQLSFVDGPDGRALQVGPQTVLNFAEHPAFTVARLTAEAWVRVGRYPVQGSFAHVVDNNSEFAIAIAPDGKVVCFIFGATTFSSVAVPLDTWTQVACVFENKAVNVVIEGKLAGGRLLGFDLPDDGTDGIFVGSDGPTPKDRLEGAIDNMRVWGRVLSFSELCQSAVNCR